MNKFQTRTAARLPQRSGQSAGNIGEKGALMPVGKEFIFFHPVFFRSRRDSDPCRATSFLRRDQLPGCTGPELVWKILRAISLRS